MHFEAGFHWLWLSIRWRRCKSYTTKAHIRIAIQTLYLTLGPIWGSLIKVLNYWPHSAKFCAQQTRGSGWRHHLSGSALTRTGLNMWFGVMKNVFCCLLIQIVDELHSTFTTAWNEIEHREKVLFGVGFLVGCWLIGVWFEGVLFNLMHLIDDLHG